MKSKNASSSLSPATFFALATAFLSGSSAYAGSGNWNADASDNWSVATRWNPTAVPGTTAGDVVSLTNNITAARTVTINTTSRTVGALNIGDPTTAFFGFTLAANGGANLTFNNNGANAGLVQTNTTVSDIISAPLVLADNLGVTNTSTLTLSGVISGAGKSITKSGAGTLALNNANTFSGGVNLNVGKLILGHATALGATAGTFSIAGGTTLDGSVANLVIANKNPVALNGNFIFTGTQNLNLGAGAFSLGSAAGSRTITVSANTLTLGGSLADGVATNLAKAGAGTLTLAGTNTYSGGATVSAGALCFLNTAAQPGSGTTTVAAGATLGLGVSGAGAFGSADIDALFANTFANVSMNATARVGVDTTAGSFTYASSASGSRGLTKLGTNTLFLSAANTYSGVTAINGGVLQLDHENALPGGIGASGGTSALTFNGGVLGLGANDFTRSLGSAATVTAANFTGTGGWAAFNADRAVNLGGSATPSTILWGTANTGFNARTLLLGASTATHTVDLKNPLDMGANATRTIQVDDGAAVIDAQFSGVISGVANATFNKTGAGTLALSSENTYVGSTLVQGGTLLVTGAGSLSGIGSTSVQGGTLAVTDTGRIGTLGTNALSVGANNYAGTLQYSSSATSCFASASIGSSIANGTLNQTAGFISVTGNVNMVIGADGYGTINLSGGTLAVGGALNVAQRGIYPATVNLSGTGVLTADSLVVADFSTSSTTSYKPSYGQFTQSGGTATVGSLVISKTSTDSNVHAGTVDLNGGTFNVGSIAGGLATGVGGTNTSTFNFNGGTLRATANSATFMQGLTAVNVKDGGAIIDTDGRDITIAQALQLAAGATAAPLTKNGAGTLTLSGTNTFVGPVTVNGGTLVLAGYNSLARSISIADGTLTLSGAAPLGAGNFAAAITNNGALVLAGSADQTLSGTLSGSGSLTQSGGGTLTLTGATPYSGATAVDAGKLVVSSDGALADSAVSLASGTSLSLRVLASDGQWGCKSLTLGSGATTTEFRFYGTTPSTTTAPLLVGGDLVNNGTLNVTVAGTSIAVGTYPLIRYTGSLTAGILGAVTLPNGGEGTLVNNTADSTIDLAVNTASAPLVWNGGTGVWDIDSTANWAGGLMYHDGDVVRFDDTSSGTAPFTVSLPANVNPGNVTVDNPQNTDYTLAGPGALAGEAGIFKKGAGTLTLAAANTSSGGLALDSGAGTVNATLSATQDSLGTGPVSVGSGSTLVLDNANTASATVTKANAISGTGSLTLTFAANATARSTALPGLSGFAGTVQVGSAGAATGDKLDASGAVAPDVTLQIADGHTLLVGSDGAPVSFGSISLRGAGNAENRGALRMAANASTLAGPLTLLGNTTLASDSAGAHLTGAITGTAGSGATNILTQGTPASAAGCTLSGAISDGANGGKVALTQTKGVLTLSGANTYSGATTINGNGTLQISALGALPSTGVVVLGGTNGAGNLALGAFNQTLPSLTAVSTGAAMNNLVTIAPGQELVINGPNGLLVGLDTNSTTRVKMAGGGALVVNHASAYVAVGKAQPSEQTGSNTSTLDLSELSSVTLGSGAAPINEIRIAYGQLCTATLTLSNTNNLLTASALQVGNSLQLNAGTGGTLILGAGANSVSVNSFVIGLYKGIGTVKFASQAAGSPGAVTIGGRTRDTTDFTIGSKGGMATGANPTGTLDLRGHAATVAAGALTLGKEDNSSYWNGGLNTNFFSSTIGSLFFDAGAFTATNLTMAAKTGGSKGAAIATLTVSGGVFTVSSGAAFMLASQAGWGSATGTLNVVGGTFRSFADIRTGTSNCVSTVNLDGGTLDMTGRAIGLGSQTGIVLNARSGTLMNLGSYNNGAPLIKTGNGTLSFAGTNTYSGATIVSNGTLRLTGPLCLPPTADLYLSAGTTTQLDYDGRLPIRTLFVDGVRKMGSLYGQDKLSPYLSGTGFLELASPGTLILLK